MSAVSSTLTRLVLLLAIALFSSAGCATLDRSGELITLTATEIEQAGNLIIYRASAEPTAWPVMIKIDGNSIASLRQGEAIALDLHRAKSMIEYDWPFLSGQENGTLAIDLAAHDQLFLAIGGSLSATGQTAPSLQFESSSFAEVVRPEKAKAILQECCRFYNIQRQ